MAKARIIALSAALAISLAACAGQPEIPFEHSDTNAIKTIGVITPRFPNGPRVILATSVGQSFGLVGALIDAGMEAHRSSNFEDVLNQQRYSARDDLVVSLTADLESEGYRTAPIVIQRDSDDFVTHPPAATAPVDAYLDLVTTTYGYMAAGVLDSTPYRPVVSLRARLVSARDNAILMQDTIVYTPFRATKNTITIAPDPAYSFVGSGDLSADPQKAVAGLHEALGQCAQTIANLLR